MEHEVARLVRAATALEERMERLVETGMGASEEGRSASLDAFRLFARCREWRDGLAAAARSGMPAESAVASTLRESRARLDGLGDPGLRGWLGEIDGLAADLLRALLRAERRQPVAYASDSVVVAPRLTAAELLNLEPRVRAVVMEKSPAAGAARVVASTLQVPVVTEVEGLAAACRGERIFVDGQNGTVRLRRAERSLADAERAASGAAPDPRMP